MSKKPKAKSECRNCDHFVSDVSNVPGFGTTLIRIEKNMRCGLGGFKVMKTAACNGWTKKEAE